MCYYCSIPESRRNQSRGKHDVAKAKSHISYIDDNDHVDDDDDGDDDAEAVSHQEMYELLLNSVCFSTFGLTAQSLRSYS